MAWVSKASHQPPKPYETNTLFEQRLSKFKVKVSVDRVKYVLVGMTDKEAEMVNLKMSSSYSMLHAPWKGIGLIYRFSVYDYSETIG